MIDLVLSKGNAFVWNAEDWLTLRKQHRIIGELIGCLAKMPRQEILHGLPLMLQPEEVTLLLEKKIARLVEVPGLTQKPSDDLKSTFEAYREQLFTEQKQRLVSAKIDQFMSNKDEIIDGKRRKILGLNTSKRKRKKQILDEATSKALNEIDIDSDTLLAEELEKLPTMQPSEAIVQIHTAYPWCDRKDLQEATWNYPLSTDDQLRYRVFKDLWEQGYFVMHGEKFGSDFMVYSGDPLMFHAHFTVVCKDRNESISILDLSTQCRVACHVKKTHIYAFLSEDGEELRYQSFQHRNWLFT